MKKEYICYCGLYCENCAVKARVFPAAQTLYGEMKAMNFEDIIQFFPGGDGFWAFLKEMAANGVCDSCKTGGGDPGCKVRLCAREKGVEACALCGEYPCGLFDEFFAGYPVLEKDNAVMRDKGMDEWAKLQDERRLEGFTYTSD